MTKLELFRAACAAAEDAPVDKYDETSNAMLRAYDEFKSEPDSVSQALTLADDPNPMVRYMVAVLIRPMMRERSDAILKAVAEESSGTASIWAMSKSGL